MLSNASVTVLHSLYLFSFHSTIASFQQFFHSSLHVSSFYRLPSFLSFIKLPSLPFSLLLIHFFHTKNSLLICENITRFLFFRLRKKYPFAWEFRFLCWLHPSIHSWICFHVKVCIYFLDFLFFIF